MTDTKAWYYSTTAWASVIGALNGILALIGVTVHVETASELAVAIAIIVTSLASLYGRFKATKVITVREVPKDG